MLTLSLFRHAKSSWDEESLKDLDRPLSERGLAAAPTMGTYLAREDLRPDCVLSSPSVRTRETAALAFKAFASPPEIQFEDALYLASHKTLLARIKRVDARIQHLMILGHNPGLHALALDLIADGAKKLIAELSDKLPSAGLVVLEFDAREWADVAAGTGRLAVFTSPRKLMAEN